MINASTMGLSPKTFLVFKKMIRHYSIVLNHVHNTLILGVRGSFHVFHHSILLRIASNRIELSLTLNKSKCLARVLLNWPPSDTPLLLPWGLTEMVLTLGTLDLQLPQSGTFCGLVCRWLTASCLESLPVCGSWRGLPNLQIHHCAPLPDVSCPGDISPLVSVSLTPIFPPLDYMLLENRILFWSIYWCPELWVSSNSRAYRT